MTKIEITSILFKIKAFDGEKLSLLIPQFTIKELTVYDDLLEVTVEETIDQTTVDALVNQLRLYVLENLIKGEILV